MTYFTRSAWGARPARQGPGRLSTSRVEGIALHWPAMGDRRIRTVSAAKDALRSWQRMHMDTNGWSDIGYQEAVDQLGNVYELRGLSIQSGANGNTDVNERFGAILLILGAGEQPSRAMLGAVRGRIARHRALFANSRRIVGHGDIRPGGTECPGPIVRGLIRQGAFDPGKPAPKPPAKTRGAAIDAALAALRKAKPGSVKRRQAVDGARKLLASLPAWPKRRR